MIKNEITAHAVGTTHLHPDVRTILEIGGQDSKIICVSDGIAVDYAMNTLCAAGTGSFLSSQAHRLGVEVEEFGDIALTSTKPANIAARCTVFAESEVISQLSMETNKCDIINGIHHSVASGWQACHGSVRDQVVMTGGVAQNTGVVKALEEELGHIIYTSPLTQYNGALGAALFAYQRYQKEQKG